MIRMAVGYVVRQRLAAALFAVGLDTLGEEALKASQSRPWRSFAWVESAVRRAIVAIDGPFRGRKQLPQWSAN